MTKRLAVLMAVKQMLAGALPGAEVLGLDGQEAPAGPVPAAGRVIVRAGDPGEPSEVTLSPLMYWWDHPIPVEIVRSKQFGQTSEEALDQLLDLINEGLIADRTLSGLVDWLDARPSETENVEAWDESGRLLTATPPRATEIIFTASYSTSGPLA